MDPYTSYTRAGPDRPTSPYAEYFTDSSSSSDGSRTSIAEFPRVRHRRRLRSPSRLLSPEGSMPRTRTRSRVRSRPTRRETSRSLSPSANSYDWQINSGNKDRDYTIHLDLEAALDISEDIERLAQLSRLGRFNEAIVLFKERLALHVDFFPVVAEYADLLLEQGNFRDLHQFVSNRLSDPHVEYTQEGYTLLELLKRLAEVHTKGALLPVLETTLITLKSFEFRSDLLPLWFRPPTGVQIQIIDACLRIVAYAAAHSSYLENHIFQPLLHWTFFNNQLRFLSFDDDILSRPSPRPSHYSDPQPDTKPLRRLQIEQGPAGHRPYSRRNRSQPNYPQIGDWYRLLVQEGHLWESHRVLRSMLALLGDAHGHYIANGGFEDFAQLDDLTKVTTAFMHRKEGSSTSEQLLLTNLANASLLASFLAHSNDKAVRKAQVHISEEARSLASTMLSNSKQLINSRPYLYWLLFQGTRGVRGDNQVHRQGLVPGIWPQSSISRVQFLKQKDTNISSRADIAGSDIHPRKSLEIVLASAKHNEDYDLQQAALRRFCRVFQRFDQCIQAVQDLALLCDDTMQDSTGHLQCLVDECLLLDSVGSSSTEGLYTNLHRRLSEFDRSFPSHFSHSPSVRQGVEIKFFDNPLLEWTKRKTLSLLLGSIGRDTEAQLSKAQLPLVERHLPRHMSPLLNIPNTCSGCEYCGGKEGLQAPLTAGANTRAPEPSFDRGLYRASHFRPFSDLPPPRPPLAIANESYRPSTPGDDMGAVVERLMAGVRDEKKAKKTERREQEQRQKRLAESKGNLGNAEEGKKFKIKGPQGPQGPAFVLSFNLFRTYEATTSDIRILSPEIDKCGYYFTGPDGNLISHHNWDFIQPGWVLTMHLNTPKEENISQSPEKTDEPDVNNDPENPEKEKDHGNNVESDRNEAQDGNEKAPSAKRGDEDRAPY